MIDDSAGVIARLNARLEALEQRVFQLEHPLESDPIAPVAAPQALEITALSASEPTSLATSSGTFTVLGKAVLGMAGAYLLRALAETGAVPKLVVVFLAIAYAGMWLVAAARVRVARSFSAFAYSLTSALILAPMLWELTWRFRVLSPSIGAGVLAAFAIAALCLTWKRSLGPVFWVGYTTSTLTALVLMIATQDLAPFLCALLVIAVASEIAACSGQALNGRALAAVGVDLAAAASLYIYSLPESARAGYSSLSVPALVALASIPFFLYFASLTLQSTLRHRQIALLEMMQIVLTFLFASYAALTFSAEAYRPAFGIVCIALSAAGYAIAFARFDDPGTPHNFRAYTTWSAVLLVFGCALSLPPLWLPLALGAAAILATAVGARRLHPALEFQAPAYLLAAAAFSGLLPFDLHSLVGSQPLAPAWIDGILLACALLCYGLGGRSRELDWRAWIPSLVASAMAAMTGAAFAMLLFTSLVERMRAVGALPEGLVEFLQTLTLCAFALGLAVGGSRGRRHELLWLAYATLVVAAAKILLEDVRHGHLLAIAASFVLYAGTLIWLPHLAAQRREHPVPDAVES